jgi:hypothetical protein
MNVHSMNEFVSFYTCKTPNTSKILNRLKDKEQTMDNICNMFEIIKLFHI